MNLKIIQCNFLKKYNHINKFNNIFKKTMIANTYVTQSMYKNNNFFIKNQKVLLIDIENVGKYKISGFDGMIIGFISNNSTLYKKLDDIKRYIHVEIFNGKEKNGADILMSIFIRQNLNNFKNYNNKIILLTKDKFGLSIKNICNQNGIDCIIKHKLDEIIK